MYLAESCSQKRGLCTFSWRKKEKRFFKVPKLVLANVDVRVHKFPDFFVLAVESLTELVVVKGLKVFCWCR